MSDTSVTYLTPADALPFWQSRACDSWCEGGHQANDHVDDRVHSSRERSEILLTLDKLSPEDLGTPDSFVPPVLEVLTTRHEVEAVARIVLIHNDANQLDLSQSEARQLIEALERALATAKTASSN